MDTKLQLSDSVLLAWTPQQICHVAENLQYNKAYPTWVQFQMIAKIESAMSNIKTTAAKFVMRSIAIENALIRI